MINLTISTNGSCGNSCVIILDFIGFLRVFSNEKRTRVHEMPTLLKLGVIFMKLVDTIKKEG